MQHANLNFSWIDCLTKKLELKWKSDHQLYHNENTNSNENDIAGLLPIMLTQLENAFKKKYLETPDGELLLCFDSKTKMKP